MLRIGGPGVREQRRVFVSSARLGRRGGGARARRQVSVRGGQLRDRSALPVRGARMGH